MARRLFKHIFILLALANCITGMTFCTESKSEELVSRGIKTLQNLKNLEVLEEIEFDTLASQVKPEELIPLTLLIVQTLRLTFVKLAHTTYSLKINTETTCFQKALEGIAVHIETLSKNLQSPEAEKVLCYFEKELQKLSGSSYRHMIKHLRLQGLYGELYQKHFSLLHQIESLLFEEENNSTHSSLSSFWKFIANTYSEIKYPVFLTSCSAVVETLKNSLFTETSKKHNLKNLSNLTSLERFEKQKNQLSKPLSQEEQSIFQQFEIFTKEITKKQNFAHAKILESVIHKSVYVSIERLPLQLALYSALLKSLGKQIIRLQSKEEKESLAELIALNQDLLSVRTILVKSPSSKKISQLGVQLNTLMLSELSKIAPDLLTQSLKPLNLGLYLIMYSLAPWASAFTPTQNWTQAVKFVHPFIEQLLLLNKIISCDNQKINVTNPLLPILGLKEFIHQSMEFSRRIETQHLQIVNNIFNHRHEATLFCGYLIKPDAFNFPSALPAMPSIISRYLVDPINKEFAPNQLSQITRFMLKRSRDAFLTLPADKISPQFCNFLNIDFSQFTPESFVFLCPGGFTQGDTALLVFEYCLKGIPLTPLHLKSLINTVQSANTYTEEGIFLATLKAKGEKPSWLFNAAISPWFPLYSLVGAAQKDKHCSKLNKIKTLEVKETELFDKFSKESKVLSETDRIYTIVHGAKSLKLLLLFLLQQSFSRSSLEESPEINVAIEASTDTSKELPAPSNEAQSLSQSLDEQLQKELGYTPSLYAQYFVLLKQLSNALKMHLGTLRKLEKELFTTIPLPSQFTILNTEGVPADLVGFYGQFFLELNKRTFLVYPSQISKLCNEIKKNYHLTLPNNSFWFFRTNRFFDRITELKTLCLKNDTLSAYSIQKHDGFIETIVEQGDFKKQLDAIEKRCIIAWENEQKIMHIFDQLALYEKTVNHSAQQLLSHAPFYFTTYHSFFKAHLKYIKQERPSLFLNDILRLLNIRTLCALRSINHIPCIQLIINNAECIWSIGDNPPQAPIAWSNKYENRMRQSLPLTDTLKKNFKKTKKLYPLAKNFSKIIQLLENHGKDLSKTA